jgi:hypothetical protein
MMNDEELRQIGFEHNRRPVDFLLFIGNNRGSKKIVLGPPGAPKQNLLIRSAV